MWHINLTTFDVVPADSPVLQFVKGDNWDSLRELFREGLASSLHCDQFDFTLFHVSWRIQDVHQGQAMMLTTA